MVLTELNVAAGSSSGSNGRVTDKVMNRWLTWPIGQIGPVVQSAAVTVPPVAVPRVAQHEHATTGVLTVA